LAEVVISCNQLKTVYCSWPQY